MVRLSSSVSQTAHPRQALAKRTYSATDIDNYAQRILESKGTQRPDSILGSYVTSLLRDTDLGSQDLREVAEFDNLVELVQEHCACSETEAVESLHVIATAVRTKQIPSDVRLSKVSLDGSDNSHIYNYDNSEFPSLTLTEHSQNLAISSTHSETKKLDSPLHVDDLIPLDLMGVLEDPSSPGKLKGTATSMMHAGESIKTENIAVGVNEAAFPPLSASAATSLSKKTKPSASKQRAHSGTSSRPQPADDLAVALFAPPRPKQSDIDDSSTHAALFASSSPPLNPTHADPAVLMEEHQYATVEMLLSMNAELGEEAAAAATSLTGDVNMAQYLIDTVLSSPPVCRNVLSGAGCYRSDCSFSHDIDGYTCAFWLRGRCGKGQSCRFLHGFNPQLLESLFGANTSYKDGPVNDSSFNFPVLNSEAATSSSTSWNNESINDRKISFANVASQQVDPGHSFQDFSSDFNTTVYAKSHTQPKKVDIPMEVWNAHENRDSSAFYIADPIERYHVVSKTVRRSDVLDLHFQSTKTFGLVLSRLLPMKLSENPEGVWIVTGTGHHVGSRTHQKGGGALEAAVTNWLYDQGYEFAKGRDRNGQSGALLVFSPMYE